VGQADDGPAHPDQGREEHDAFGIEEVGKIHGAAPVGYLDNTEQLGRFR
jgi:hypothetical protein